MTAVRAPRSGQASDDAASDAARRLLLTANVRGLQCPIGQPEETLLLVKPDAVKARNTGEIIHRLEEAGFTITGIIMRRLDRNEAAGFYRIHTGKEFFPGLIEFITCGPLVAVRLEGDGIRRRVRDFVGVTDPARAAAGTIRADFGTTVRMNAVHASNPEEDVAAELRLFFPDSNPKEVV